MTREQIIKILEDNLFVSDQWGGEKLAKWKYAHDVFVSGIEDAASELLRLELENLLKCDDVD